MKYYTSLTCPSPMNISLSKLFSCTAAKALIQAGWFYVRNNNFILFTDTGQECVHIYTHMYCYDIVKVIINCTSLTHSMVLPCDQLM